MAAANPVPKAKRAGYLPKWQKPRVFCQNGRPLQILCQTLCKIGRANTMPNKIFFSTDFFRLQMPMLNVG
jgi:hypothetical protein